MDHHDDVGASLQRFAITGGLIAAVAVVGVVDERRQPKTRGDRRRVVAARIVHQNPLVDGVRQFGDGRSEGARRVVRRQHHREALSVDHDARNSCATLGAA
jgi:hypothetical protein